MAATGCTIRLCLRPSRALPITRLFATPRPAVAFARRQAFATTRALRADDRTDGRTRTSTPYPHLEDVFKDLSPEQLKQLDELVKTDDQTREASTLTDVLRTMENEDDVRAMMDPYDQDLRAVLKSSSVRASPGSMWHDETDEDSVPEEEAPEFAEDDITTMAHGKLDEIREHRHYARIAAWEMPLLSKLAKPFAPPTADQKLRFRYTTYMGEFHPAEKKVVVEFSPSDLGLTTVQADKLRKLVGPRYNPDKDQVRMSCDSFGQPAQNKRYLSDLVDTLIKEAKDPKDTFEDVPLDTRHHHTQKKPKFPREWRMTEERRAELDAIREKAALADEGKAAEGQLVDGAKSIDVFLNPPKKLEDKPAAGDPIAELVAAARPRASAPLRR